MNKKTSTLKLNKRTKKKMLIVVVSAVLALFGINSQPAKSFINNNYDTIVSTISPHELDAQTEESQFKSFSLIDEAKPYAKHVVHNDTEAEKAQVLRVVDGDTLIVRLNKQQVRIRLIGIDAPESVHPDAAKNTDMGKSASAHLKAGLHKGDTVYLTYDKEKTDKYKRTLAYVWLANPPQNPTEEDVENLMLNGILVAKGYANPKAFKPNTLYKKVFESIANHR